MHSLKKREEEQSHPDELITIGSPSQERGAASWGRRRRGFFDLLFRCYICLEKVTLSDASTREVSSSVGGEEAREEEEREVRAKDFSESKKHQPTI